MDQIVLGGGEEEEEDVGLDIEEGVNERQEEKLDNVWSGCLSYDGSEKTNDDDDDDLINPLIGGEKRRRERSSQSLELSDKKFDNVKFNKTRKPPRPPKGPSLSANDHKLMREIAELAMRKRARIERMKTLRRMKTAKSSPCSSVFAMIVTVTFFVFLIFQGFFTSNPSLNSDHSPAPSRIVSVQLYNEFAPRERIDPSPTTTTSFRYKRVSGADNEEDTREVTR